MNVRDSGGHIEGLFASMTLICTKSTRPAWNLWEEVQVWNQGVLAKKIGGQASHGCYYFVRPSRAIISWPYLHVRFYEFLGFFNVNRLTRILLCIVWLARYIWLPIYKSSISEVARFSLTVSSILSNSINDLMKNWIKIREIEGWEQCNVHLATFAQAEFASKFKRVPRVVTASKLEWNYKPPQADANSCREILIIITLEASKKLW